MSASMRVSAVLLLVVLGLGVAMMMRGQGARLFGPKPVPVEVSGQSPPAATLHTDRSLSKLGDYGEVPEFDLISHTGDPLRHTDLLGSLWVGDFIFTNCASTCPMMTRTLFALADAIDPELGVRYVSFSVDPERDTPQVLAEYAQEFGADAKDWLFLTGDKQTLRDLVLKGFHLSVQDATREDLLRGAEAVIHSTRFVLVDTGGTIRGYYDGTDDEAMAQLLADIRTLHSQGQH